MTDSRGRERLILARGRFADLPGWQDDAVGDAIPAFLASCAQLDGLAPGEAVGFAHIGGQARHWRRACRRAARVPSGNHRRARAFFESEFRVYSARSSGGPRGKLSGYYVQELSGSLRRHGRYQTPVLKRPPDLVSVQLSSFVDDGRGRRIWGRVSGGQLVPYPTRRQIRLAGTDPADVLVWVDDPVDALFAEIQGSGRVHMDDGSVRWIAFAGKNGRRFRGVAGILRRMGELARGEGTMQGTRAWFEANPQRIQEISDKNPAKVFFEFSERSGAIGSQGVVLTPRRSAAVDRAVIPLSTPLWIAGRAPIGPRGKVVPWRSLVIAQDTGGAILGPIRADIYWGADDAAAAIAGRMGGPGRVWLLLPRGMRIDTRPRRGNASD